MFKAKLSLICTLKCTVIEVLTQWAMAHQKQLTRIRLHLASDHYNFQLKGFSSSVGVEWCLLVICIQSAKCHHRPYWNVDIIPGLSIDHLLSVTFSFTRTNLKDNNKNLQPVIKIRHTKSKTNILLSLSTLSISNCKMISKVIEIWKCHMSDWGTYLLRDLFAL